MKKNLQQRVSGNSELVRRRASNQVTLSAFDIATDLQSVGLLIPDDILHPSPWSDPLPPPSNDTDPVIGLPEPEAEVNALYSQYPLTRIQSMSDG